MKPRYLRILLVLVTFTTLHVVVLWNEPQAVTELNFGVPGGIDASVESLIGWVMTPAGLAIPPELPADEPTGVRIGIWKSRFHDLKLSVTPTSRGRGKVVARLIDDQVTSAQLTSPFKKQSTPDWRLVQGRPENQADLTGLQSSAGDANLAWAWPDTTAGYVYLERTAGATGPLVRSVRFERSVAGWTYFLLPLFWLPLAALSVGLLDLLNDLRQQRAVALAGLAMIPAICLLPLELLEYGHLLMAVVAVAAVAVAVRRRRPKMIRTWLLLLLIAFAANSRFEGYQYARHEPLDPDALGFLQIAEKSTGIYDTQFREPAIIAMVKTSAVVFGNNPAAVRFVSMVGSLLLVVVVWWAGNELFRQPVGLIAAALVATSDEWAGQAVRGLRLEWFTAAVLIVTALLFASTREQLWSRRRLTALSFAATVTCLLRMTSLWFIVAAVVVRAIVDRRWKPAAVVLLILSAAVLPFFVHSAATYGDAFFVMNRHIQFYRNHEFKDQPGFPTTDQLQQDAYAGPPTTAVRYFFGMHSVTELAKRTATQSYSIFAGDKLQILTCGGNQFLYLWALIAMAVVCVRRWPLAIWMGVLIGPIAWLYSPVSEPEWRLIFHVSPLIYLCMGYTAVLGLNADRTPSVKPSTASKPAETTA